MAALQLLLRRAPDAASSPGVADGVEPAAQRMRQRLDRATAIALHEPVAERGNSRLPLGANRDGVNHVNHRSPGRQVTNDRICLIEGPIKHRWAAGIGPVVALDPLRLEMVNPDPRVIDHAEARLLDGEGESGVIVPLCSLTSESLVASQGRQRLTSNAHIDALEKVNVPRLAGA